MRSINDITGKIPNLQAQVQKVKEETFNHPEVIQLIKDNPSIPNELWEQNIPVLQEYIHQSKQCERCNCLDECINYTKGMAPVLHLEEHDITISYKPCDSQLAAREQQKLSSLIQSHHISKDILSANFDSLQFNSKKKAAIAAKAVQIAMGLEHGETPKGLYIHGPFGRGKSYILGATANELKSKHIPSVLVYWPEFIRELKASIKKGTTEDKVQAMKNARVLMIDDLGAEDLSEWTRDEILGAILHYRMINEMPTFISSNLTIDELSQHLATVKSKVDTLKADRIIERILTLMEPVEIDGDNLRNKSL